MNKLTKLMLASALLATSGFATEIATFADGVEVRQGATFEMKNETIKIGANKNLDVYGSVLGNGRVVCQGDGHVNIYERVYAENAEIQNAVLESASMAGKTVHTLIESGATFSNEIVVEPAQSKRLLDGDLGKYALGLGENDVIYVANGTGSDIKLTGNDEGLCVTCGLTNKESNVDGLKPASLIITKKVNLSGDNSGFKETGKTIQIGECEHASEVLMKSSKSVLPVDTAISAGSKLDINIDDDMIFAHNINVQSERKVLQKDTSVILSDTRAQFNVTGKFILASGATLTLGSDVEEVVPDSPYKYPNVMTWPEDSFTIALVESDGKDGFAEGTLHDTVFSYTTSGTAGTDLQYHRTHDAFLGKNIDFTKSKSRVCLENSDKTIVVEVEVHGVNETYYGVMTSAAYSVIDYENGLLESTQLSKYTCYVNPMKRLYSYEGNFDVGYYWKPTDYDACLDEMKNLYNDLKSGELVESYKNWSWKDSE